MVLPNWDNAPITRTAFGAPEEPKGQRGPRPIEREWGEIVKSEQDVIVYWGGMWNRRDTLMGWGWYCWHVRGDEYSKGQPHPAIKAPASSVERILSPLAHEARIRIMQAMYDGPKSSGMLSQATGLTGGNLYYHLKELMHAAYVREKDGAYDLSPLGCQMLVTISMIAHEIVKDRGEEGLLVASVWEQSEASLKPLRYSISEGCCDKGLAQALQITINEVLGSSSTAAPGETYLVRGEYALSDPQVGWLRLAGQGVSGGRQAAVSVGSGKFEVTAEIKEVVAGKERVLDLLMADKAVSHIGVHTRINLEG